MLREWIHSRRWHRAVVETFTSVCPDQWLGRCAASCEETNPVAEVGAQLAAGTFSPQCQWNKTHHYVCSWGHGFDSKPTVWKVLNSQPYNFLSRGILLEGTVSWQVLSLWPSLWCEVTFFFFKISPFAVNVGFSCDFTCVNSLKTLPFPYLERSESIAWEKDTRGPETPHSLDRGERGRGSNAVPWFSQWGSFLEQNAVWRCYTLFLHVFFPTVN